MSKGNGFFGEFKKFILRGIYERYFRALRIVELAL